MYHIERLVTLYKRLGKLKIPQEVSEKLTMLSVSIFKNGIKLANIQ